MTERSKAIFDTMNFVRRLGRELGSLGEEISENLPEHAKSFGLRITGPSAAGGGDSWMSDSKELLYQVKTSGTKRAFGFVTYLCDLARPTGLADKFNQAMLAVCYCANVEQLDPPFDHESFDGWEEQKTHWEFVAGKKLAIWKDPASSSKSKKGSSVFRDPPDPNTACWFYCLPLANVSDRRSVNTLLIDPVLLLLKGTRTNVVFDERAEISAFN
jgi:hypothetical protein